MKTSLDYRKDYLCVLSEREVRHGPHIGLLRQWYPVHKADQSEVRTLLGLPVTQIQSAGKVFMQMRKEMSLGWRKEGEPRRSRFVTASPKRRRTGEGLRTVTASRPWRKPRAKITAAEREGTEDPRFKGRREWSAATQAAVRK